MTNLYEGMFVLDNKVVRQGWKSAKATVTDILTKHEANTITARRWDERRLSYPIKRRGRATYLLAYFELSKDAGPKLNRSLELNETVLRYLITRVDAVPAKEAELASREESEDFVVPAPPVEDESARVVEPQPEPEKAAKTEDAEAADGEAVKEGESEAKEGESSDALETVAAVTATEASPESASTEETKSDEGA